MSWSHKYGPPSVTLEQVPVVLWASIAMSVKRISLFVSLETQSDFWVEVWDLRSGIQREGVEDQHCYLTEEEFETQRGQ